MQTIKYKGLEATVHEATVRDDLHAQIIFRKLTAAVPNGELGLWQSFADTVAATVSIVGLSFDPATLHTQDEATVNAAYEAYLELPKRFKDKWVKAYSAENADADPVTGPTPLPEGADPNL